MKQLLVVLLLALLVVCAVATAPAAPAPAAAPKDPRSGFARKASDFANGPNDVHVFVKDVVNAHQSGDALVRVENKFVQSSERLMGGLNKVMRKVSQHVKENSAQEAAPAAAAAAPAPAAPAAAAKVSLAEVAAAQQITPIIDGTGSAAFTPKADLTKFKVKPVIDASVMEDPKIAQIEAEQQQREAKRAAAAEQFRQQISQLHAAQVAASSGTSLLELSMHAFDSSELELESFVELYSLLDSELQSEAEADAELEESALQMEAQMEDEYASMLEAAAAVDTEMEAEAELEAEAEAELEAEVEAEAEAEAEAEVEAELEAESESEADSDAWTDPELVDSDRGVMVDAEFVHMELEAEATPVIIDDTGSAAFTPKADLTKYKVKAVIDASVVQDPKIAQIEAEQEKHEAKRATAAEQFQQQIRNFQAVQAAAAAQQASASMLETQTAPQKQDLPVVEGALSVAPIDRPLIEAQHNAVNWMLQNQDGKINIRQADLDAANNVNIAAQGHLQHVADFKEAQKDQPLLPNGM